MTEGTLKAEVELMIALYGADEVAAALERVLAETPPPSSQTPAEEHRSRDEVKTLKITQELNPDGEVRDL